MTNTVDIMNRGMKCLTDHMGVIDAETFISVIIRERFDYTEWRRKHFDAMAPGEFHAQAQEYAKAHPYTGKAARI